MWFQLVKIRLADAGKEWSRHHRAPAYEVHSMTELRQDIGHAIRLLRRAGIL
jgi:hypothetical protein